MTVDEGLKVTDGWVEFVLALMSIGKDILLSTRFLPADNKDLAVATFYLYHSSRSLRFSVAACFYCDVYCQKYNKK